MSWWDLTNAAVHATATASAHPATTAATVDVVNVGIVSDVDLGELVASQKTHRDTPDTTCASPPVAVDDGAASPAL